MIFIIGNGGRAKLIKELILRTTPKEKIRFLSNPKNLNFKILKKKMNSHKNSKIFIGISDPKAQKKYYSLLKKKKIKVNFKPLIDPSAIIKSNVTIGSNTLILENSVIGPNAKIGKNVFIGSSVIINHDSVVGNFNTIGHRSNIAGKVIIGNECFVGISSTIQQNIKIGNNVILGSASNVIKSCQSSNTYYGNPAKKNK